MKKVNLSLWRAVACVALAVVVGASAFLLKNPAMPVSATPAEKPLPIYCVSMSEKKAAITFDASWGDGHTKQILEILDKYDAKATFFLVGIWVERYPDEVKLISEKGHEIGNHSSNHPSMSKMSAESIKKEILPTSEKITAITGKPVTLFRAPYGDYDSNLVKTTEALNHRIIQWNCDAHAMGFKLW